MAETKPKPTRTGRCLAIKTSGRCPCEQFRKARAIGYDDICVCGNSQGIHAKVEVAA